jgi:hypothetical protein
MKVSTTKITVEVDLEEWKKLFSEWETIKYSDKQKFDMHKHETLYTFLEYINTVAQNPSHKIEHKL